MATAAQRVFAIPELLERILLYVYNREIVPYFWTLSSSCCYLDNEDYYDVPPNKLNLMRAVKRLFVLQRVNKSFEGTILGSCHLRRRMGLEYFHQKEDKCAWESQLLFRWFEFLDPNHTMVVNLETFGDDNDMLKVTLNFSISTLMARAPIKTPKSSWHKVKLTTAEMPIQVKTCVWLSSLPISSNPTYDELINFDAGQGTLGDVDAIVKTIRNRSVAKHWVLANGDKIRRLEFLIGGVLALTLVLSALGINMGVEVGRGVTKLFEVVKTITAELCVCDSALWTVLVLVPIMSIVVTKLIRAALD